MRAVGLYRYLPIEDPESLVDVEIPEPEARGRDLRVRVKAVSVNPVDVKVRSPKDGLETTPRVLGWDAAGVVEAVGEEVSLFSPGDEVYYAGSNVRPGCDSELHLVDERIVGRKPRNLSWEEAAAMPLTTLTAWEVLFDRMGVPRRPQEEGWGSVIVIGGAGGVGSIAIQVARRVAGLRVIATASREDSAEWCRSLGAHSIIDHTRPFTEELQRIGEPEVDYVLCFNSTEKHIQNMADAIKPQGKIGCIVGAKDNQPIPTSIFMRKSVAFCWELMFTRPAFQTPDLRAQHDILNEAAGLFENGTLRHTMREIYGPLNAENLRRAHAAIESGRTIGKIVLTGIE
ncbi:MAG TPA: zinc-binding alcohol dehydrogenase family protein [Thermoanaerobaculia bacterium]|jgi:zinc-binding alcohol dehydrogenase family protein|nr:zinc-binding alcohol dehydrogenase family protein [Thermoanaerobaculia bacterium]